MSLRGRGERRGPVVGVSGLRDKVPPGSMMVISHSNSS